MQHLGEFQKHCTKWKQPNSKGYILHDSLHITFWKRQKTIGKIPAQLLLGAECRGRVTVKGHREHFESDGNIFCLDCGGGYTAVWSLSKLTELCNLALQPPKVIFIECKCTWIKKLNLKKVQGEKSGLWQWKRILWNRRTNAHHKCLYLALNCTLVW